MEAIILAAGLGTRLHPLTATRPKPALPIAGKPILVWIIESLQKAGVNRFHVVVHQRKDEVIKVCQSIDANFNFIEEFILGSEKFLVFEK